jgi:hypothetical protein
MASVVPSSRVRSVAQLTSFICGTGVVGSHFWNDCNAVTESLESWPAFQQISGQACRTEDMFIATASKKVDHNAETAKKDTGLLQINPNCAIHWPVHNCTGVADPATNPVQ